MSDAEPPGGKAPQAADVIPTEAPHPGSQRMPRWTTGELIDAPRFTWKNWFAMLGPGLVMGGAAIGGGEWLIGPLVTAKYGGALLWLATISILGQVIYNIEISRYTLYSGEPIFNGKFRTPPGPMFWLIAYLAFDFGAVFPYLAANAATPVATLIKGGVVPNPLESNYDWWLMRLLAYAIFILALIPLLFGGKIYNSLKWVMSFKIVVVFSVLLVLAFGYSSRDSWWEITSGFFKFGTVPIERAEDLNGNGVLDEGEDWDGDGKLDVVEPKLGDIKLAIQSGDWPDFDGDGQPDAPRDSDGDGELDRWGTLQIDGKAVAVRRKNNEERELEWPDWVHPPGGKTDGRADTFIDLDHDGYRDGYNVDNVFMAAVEGRPFPTIDFSMLGIIAALAAIAGSGGLSNTVISNYTRDQGWGMGHHVGAIPSVVGGRNISLSHMGCVFDVNEESLPRWRRWYRHVVRDQVVVWLPACFIGLALPTMLSVEFLRRGFESDNWTAAAMTAGGVQERVAEQSGAAMGQVFWFLTLFCGFLVLAPSMSTSADGIIRRWVDVFWTSSARMRRMEDRHIKKVYFRVLAAYSVFGLIMLSMDNPVGLIQYATMFFNIALGFSCWHTLALNVLLLPRELRPNWCVRVMLALTGVFFFGLGTLTILNTLGLLA